MKKKQIAFFEKLEKELSKTESTFHNKYKRVSISRVILFLVFAGLVFHAITHGYQLAGSLLIVLFIFLFGLLVNYHSKIALRRNHYRNLVTVNKEEILRLNNKFHDFEAGNNYFEEHHPYTYDLDIFGKNSIYQLLNRTGTPNGAAMLAEWLSNSTSGSDITQRQKAVQELTDKTSWCQSFQAFGKATKGEDHNFDFLMQWFQGKDHIRNKSLYKWLIRIIPFIVLLHIIALAIGLINFYGMIPILLINGWILTSTLPLVRQTHEVTSGGIYLLQPYIDMIRAIEQEPFEHVKLTTLKTQLSIKNKTASHQIRTLKRILSFFDSRSNMLYGILNIFFLININLLLLAENWREHTGKEVSKWIDVVSEMECINSLTGFARANPEYTFPVITKQKHLFDAQSLGHPLIAPEKRINNDFKLEGTGGIAIITGSNMAGKSTFLRTVGVNIVLALAGAPVCADKLSISPVRLYSSMRTKDNLEENISSFYAELLRISELLNTAGRHGYPVFFLLDELLKGTNSQDRHHGAAALIRQLHELGTMGLVSTHDLELGQLTKEISEIDNYSFNSYFEHDELIFEYKLQKGVCRSFNASRLMEKMGIRINPE